MDIAPDSSATPCKIKGWCLPGLPVRNEQHPIQEIALEVSVAPTIELRSSRKESIDSRVVQYFGLHGLSVNKHAAINSQQSQSQSHGANEDNCSSNDNQADECSFLNAFLLRVCSFIVSIDFPNSILTKVSGHPTSREGRGGPWNQRDDGGILPAIMDGADYWSSRKGGPR